MVIMLQKVMILVAKILQTDLTLLIQMLNFAVVGPHYLLIKVEVGFESTNNNFCACIFVSVFDYF